MPTTFVNTARARSGHGLQVDVRGQVAASTNSSSQSATMIGVAAALVTLFVVFGSLLAALLPLLSTQAPAALALEADVSDEAAVIDAAAEPTQPGAGSTRHIERVTAAYPGGRLGQPEDIVGLTTFLCSDAASHISGTVVTVRPPVHRLSTLGPTHGTERPGDPGPFALRSRIRSGDQPQPVLKPQLPHV